MSALVVLLAQLAITGSVSQADANGSYTVVLDIPAMPVSVGVGSEWAAEYTWRLPAGHTIKRVRTFFAVDRGNLFEGHLMILAGDYYLATRGPHKENISTYDAWEVEDASYKAGAGGADVNVYALCRPTVAKAINCHVGVVLEIGQ